MQELEGSRSWRRKHYRFVVRINETVENNLDALVRLHTPWPPGIIGGPHQYDIPHNITDM